jgi:hypothetical protein
MNSDWAFVLILAFGNIIGSYSFASHEKKREAGVQAFTASLALLGSFCVARFVLAKLITLEVSVAVAILLMLLTSGVVYFAIGSFTWRLFKGFLQKS